MADRAYWEQKVERLRKIKQPSSAELHQLKTAEDRLEALDRRDAKQKAKPKVKEGEMSELAKRLLAESEEPVEPAPPPDIAAASPKPTGRLVDALAPAPSKSCSPIRSRASAARSPRWSRPTRGRPGSRWPRSPARTRCRVRTFDTGGTLVTKDFALHIAC